MGRVGKVADPGQPLPDPRPVRLGRRGRVLELAIGDDPPLGGVDEEHVAGPDAALCHDLRDRDVQDARLGRHDGPAVGGDVVARRPQPVSIQRRAHAHAVGEGDRGRAIPRLHEAGVVLVEGPELRRHRLVAAPGLRHQHHHRVRQRTAGQVEQLQDVVQDRGVGALRVDRREHLLEVVSEQRRAEHRLTGVEPVDVAAERVDLAVVGDVPVGVGPGPRRERVGGEARVDHRDRAREARVHDVRVEREELRRVQHPLVDDGPAAQRSDVEVPPAGQRRARDGLLDEAPGDEQAAIERDVIGGAGRPADEHLADHRLARPGGVAEARRGGRDVAPAEQVEALGREDPGDVRLAGHPAGLVAGQEEHADAESGLTREPEPLLRRHGVEESERHLGQHPGAIPGVALRPAGPPVLQVDQHRERVAHDPVGGPARDVAHEPEPAGIVFERRFVEGLGHAGFPSCARSSDDSNPPREIGYRRRDGSVAVSDRRALALGPEGDGAPAPARPGAGESRAPGPDPVWR